MTLIVVIHSFLFIVDASCHGHMPKSSRWSQAPQMITSTRVHIKHVYVSASPTAWFSPWETRSWVENKCLPPPSGSSLSTSQHLTSSWTQQGNARKFHVQRCRSGSVVQTGSQRKQEGRVGRYNVWHPLTLLVDKSWTRVHSVSIEEGANPLIMCVLNGGFYLTDQYLSAAS